MQICRNSRTQTRKSDTAQLYTSVNKINPAQATRVPGDLLEVLAEKLVLSGQLLISMLEELKRNAALSNFAALNSNIAQHDVAYREKAAQLHAELAVLQQQLMDQQVCITDLAYGVFPALFLHCHC